MKSATILMLSFIALLFVACESDGKGGNTDSSNALDNSGSTEQPMVTPPANVNTGNSGVQHYTCPNNCEGSGGPAPGDCPVCGTTYAHNAAYHDQPGMDQPQQPQAMPGAPQPQAMPGAPQPQAMPGAPPAAEPAQNAKGVWHYTCSAGCAGGAGSAGNCAMCGNALQHNQAYHQ